MSIVKGRDNKITTRCRKLLILCNYGTRYFNNVLRPSGNVPCKQNYYIVKIPITLYHIFPFYYKIYQHNPFKLYNYILFNNIIFKENKSVRIAVKTDLEVYDVHKHPTGSMIFFKYQHLVFITRISLVKRIGNEEKKSVLSRNSSRTTTIKYFFS